MAEFESGGHWYRTGKLNARAQLHLLRNLGPLLGSMMEMAVAQVDPIQANGQERMRIAGVMFLQAFGRMSHTELDELVNQCLAVTQRREGANGQGLWQPVWVAGREQYEDMDMGTLVTITRTVIQENLGGFLGGSGVLPDAAPDIAATTTAPLPG